MVRSDLDLIESVKGGDLRSFGQLVDRHKARAMTLAVRMLKSAEEAEEAVQDAFVRAYQSLPAFEGRSSFSTWFYRIVFNVCSTALRKKRPVDLRSLEARTDDGFPEPEDQGAGPDTVVESEELKDIISEAIDALPPNYAGIVSLFFLQERSYEEIVDITGLPLGTVKVRLFRARAMLRSEIVQRLDPAERSRALARSRAASF
jgi:RNA polymerase sigma factor (sigma-70 family)